MCCTVGGENGQPAHVNERIGDVYIRNVTTDIRRYYSDDSNGEMIKDGKFDLHLRVAGLLHRAISDICITSSTKPFCRDPAGLDIVMVPIDGSYTMSLDGAPTSRRRCALPWCCRCTAS